MKPPASQSFFDQSNDRSSAKRILLCLVRQDVAMTKCICILWDERRRRRRRWRSRKVYRKKIKTRGWRRRTSRLNGEVKGHKLAISHLDQLIRHELIGWQLFDVNFWFPPSPKTGNGLLSSGQRRWRGSLSGRDSFGTAATEGMRSLDCHYYSGSGRQGGA